MGPVMYPFNAEIYRSRNPDLAALALDPWEHFQKSGFAEGREYFDPDDKRLRLTLHSLPELKHAPHPYLLVAVAERLLLDGEYASSLDLLQQLAPPFGRAVAVEIDALIGLGRLDEASLAVAVHAREDRLIIAWFSSHGAAVERLVASLVKNNSYSDAAAIVRSLPALNVSPLTRRGVEYISGCVPSPAFGGANAGSSEERATQAELSDETDAAIEGYWRAVILDGANTSRLLPQIEALYAKKVELLLASADNRAALEFCERAFSTESSHQQTNDLASSLLLKIAQSGSPDEDHNLISRALELARRLNPSMLVDAICQTIAVFKLRGTGAQARDPLESFKIALPIVEQFAASVDTITREQLESFLSGWGYSAEISHSFSEAVDLYRLAYAVNPREDTRKRVGEIAHHLIGLLISAGNVSEAQRYTSELHGAGFLANLWIGPDVLFDAEFYKSQLPYELPRDVSSLEHYFAIGAFEDFAPSALFDGAFYRRTYLDLAKTGEQPLQNFLRVGQQEGRLPFGDAHLYRLHSVEDALQRNKSSVLLKNIRRLLLLLRGDLFILRNELSEADFPSAFGLLLSGCAHLETEGRHRDAISGYQTLISLQPDCFVPYYRMGILLRTIGDLGGAMQQLAKARELADGVEYVEEATESTEALLDVAKDKTEEAKRNLLAGDFSTARECILRANTARWIGNGTLSEFGVANDNADLLIFDTSFPDPISGFRYSEFSYYLKNMPSSRVLSSNWDLRKFGGQADFADMAYRYARDTDISPLRVTSFDRKRNLSASTVYSVFLNHACVTLDKGLFHVDNIAFTLYPGGGFSLYDEASDRKLDRILSDHHFQKVITTQKITYDYLVSRGCATSKILHIFGGLVEGCLHPKPLNRVPLHESRTRPLRVCFVAQRYTERGLEKGYDVFVELANRFSGFDAIEFHVVGGFDASVIELKPESRIRFHGVQQPEFFGAFYSQMDIIISCNISGYELAGGRGSFDGFPTTVCVEAGVAGVVMFLSDTLGLNKDVDGFDILKPGEEFELITRDIDHIADLLIFYIENREALHTMGLLGREALLRLFSVENQLSPRLDMLKTLSGNG